jgi:hypothetical protein
MPGECWNYKHARECQHIKKFLKAKNNVMVAGRYLKISHFKSLKPLKRIIVYMPELIL